MNIIIDSSKNNIKKFTETDKNGFYGFMSLPPSTYMLTFTKEGFMTVKRNISHQGAGKTTKVNVILKKR